MNLPKYGKDNPFVMDAVDEMIIDILDQNFSKEGDEEESEESEESGEYDSETEDNENEVR